jgi:DNA-binding LacI/PurR family transcriptional regulator
MEAEGLISRRQGHGTRVTYRTAGYPGKVETIAVIAAAQNPFFSSFISFLEAAAERHDALVVFKQATRDPPEDILFKFYLRGVRNAVIWPYDDAISVEKLERLRGLGANFVFFDRNVDSPATDSVSVNNGHAVGSLHEHLTSRGCRSISYFGWDNDVLTSNREREVAFRAIAPCAERIHRLPWRRESNVEADIRPLLAKIGSKSDGFLCGNGVIGIAVKRNLMKRGIDVPVACVDDLPGAAEIGLTVYAQPMQQLSKAAFARLVAQNADPGAWRAKTYLLKGKLIER